MDEEIEYDLERYRKVVEELDEAMRQRVEWSQKESRYQEKRKALLQLLIDRANEVREPLPDELVTQAANILGSQVYGLVQNLKTIEEQPQAKLEVPATQATTATAPSESLKANQWIEETVIASGVSGITPTEISTLAEKNGFQIHKNYPYVVLGKLLEKGTVVKRGKKYYKA